MQIKTKDGNNISGSAAAIVRIMKETHWQVGEISRKRYMERVREDANRLFGVDVSTASPREFLDSLARNGMIEIVEED